MKNIVSTDELLKKQITDLISENLTDSDLESRDTWSSYNKIIKNDTTLKKKNFIN